MEPLELLRQELDKYEKAFQKSFKSYQKGEIKSELHEIHKKNLEPKIFKYRQAINILKNWVV